MNKKIIIGIMVMMVAIIAIIAIAQNNGPRLEIAGTAGIVGVTGVENKDSENNSESDQMSVTKQGAEKIEVVHFHGTHQCWSCITVGKYALKTIKERFSEEYASGKIIFKDINAELLENRDIVMKYQARGSSLFVNAIKNGQDNIGEDVEVWRLVTNETQYINYFENKLRNLLGK